MTTEKQKQVLNYLEKFIKTNGYAPSLEEISKHFRFSSRSTAHYYIQTLRDRGYLNKLDYQARAIELNKGVKNSKNTLIPLLGVIPAGGPIEAIRNREPIEVPRSMLSKGMNHYALKISGTSMIEEGISDGDVIIIKEQSAVDDGEKAVAYLPDENKVTLKKIYRDKNRIKLVPANKFMKPFYTKNIEIQGKVVGVLRKEI